MKQLIQFVKKWSDLLIILPASALFFTFGDRILRAIDPTAQILSIEHLSILSFNLLCLFCIFIPAYFIWNLYFHDLFDKGWQNRLPPVAAYIINGVLWLATLTLTACVMLRNL